MGGALVPWSSKKQRTVSTSTTKGKYVTLDHALRERVWIRRYEMALENGEKNSTSGGESIQHEVARFGFRICQMFSGKKRWFINRLWVFGLRKNCIQKSAKCREKTFQKKKLYA